MVPVFELPPNENVAIYESVTSMPAGRYYSLVQRERDKIAECLQSAAKKYKVPYNLLLAIRQQEAGVIGMTQKAARSHDMGVMQINTLWLKEIKKQHPNITWKTVSHSACVNAYFAGSILRYNIDKAKGDLWAGVGNYHHHYLSNKKRHEQYKLRVMKRYRKILKKELKKLKLMASNK